MKRLALVAAVVLAAGIATTALAATAEENYKEHCLKCHGENGDGHGPAADVLDVPAADFTDCEHMKSLSDDYLLNIIKGGGEAVGKSPQMPAAGKIPEAEYPALVEYIRSFCEE
ncbi:MAG: cytochrome c [Candidatus Dadabacteria bacterium]|nr:MAG: cytochrome c [Candidatus Dadabacteria bacterium]